MAEIRHNYTLSIYLIKNKFKCEREIIKIENCEAPRTVSIDGDTEGTLYVKRGVPTIPRWVPLFKGIDNIGDLFTLTVSAAFIQKCDERYFVLTFGQGGHFLLRNDVAEERFGLLCTLNSVQEKSLRSVDVQSLDAIQSHSRIQTGQGATSEEFGLDVEQDLLKAVVGTPVEEELGLRMSGADSLNVSVHCCLKDIPGLLARYKKNSEIDLNGTRYEWVNNIFLIKDEDLVELLDSELDSLIAKRDLKNLRLCIPEVIDWNKISRFTFTGKRQITYPDISIDNWLRSLKQNEEPSLDKIKGTTVHCVDPDGNPIYKNWSLYKCLYAEIEAGSEGYVLNDGRWYGLNLQFAKRVDDAYSKIPKSKAILPEYCGGGEGVYNLSVAHTFPEIYAYLDKDLWRKEGGRGEVEICDLFSIKKEFIHVKIYSRSSFLSHLFSQGLVSGQLFQLDNDYRAKVKEKLMSPFSEIIDVVARPKTSEYCVVFAIIDDDLADMIRMPFFSKVNIHNISKMLLGFGFDVKLQKIPIEVHFANTSKRRLKKARKK